MSRDGHGRVSYEKCRAIAGVWAMKSRFTLRVGAAILLIALGTLVPRSTAYALTNGLCLTPPMGWSSWNTFHCSVTETEIMQMADAMATNGMMDAGYTTSTSTIAGQVTGTRTG